MGLVDLPVDGDGGVEELDRLLEPALAAAQGALQLQEESLVERIEPATGEVPLGGPERLLGLLEVPLYAQDVGEPDPRPGLGRLPRAGAVSGAEPPGQVDRQPQQILGRARVLLDGRVGPVDQQLEKTPGLEPGLVQHPPAAPHLGLRSEPPPETGGRGPLGGEAVADGGDLLAPAVEEAPDQALVVLVRRSARRQGDQELLTGGTEQEMALEGTARAVR